MGAWCLAGLIALGGCAGPTSHTRNGVTVGTGPKTKGPASEKIERSARAIGKVRTTAGEGLGFVIDPAGIILTNRHVIADGDHVVSFELPDAVPPRRFEAVRVLYTDAKRDLALLEVDTDSPLPSLPLATLDFEPAEDYLRVGSKVTIVRALAEDGKQDASQPRSGQLTQGDHFLLATEEVRSVDRSVPEVETGPFIELGHDVVAGQSGGPVIDNNGRAVGVVTWTWRHRVGGFAVPIAEVNRMLAERPRVDDRDELERRARQRVQRYMDALAADEIDLARHMTSPSYARTVRAAAVERLMGEGDPDNSVLSTWVQLLEGIAQEHKGDQGAAFGALNQVAARVSSPGYKGMQEIATVPLSQRLSFFLEIGQGYLAARMFEGKDMRDALVGGLQRLESLDAARSFALAEMVVSVSHLDVRVERVDVRPGMYAPTAVAFLRILGSEVGSGPAQEGRFALSLKLEWGDWYVAGVQPVSGG